MNIRFSSRTHLIQAPQKRISIHGINKKRDCLDLENTQNTTKDCRSSSFMSSDQVITMNWKDVLGVIDLVAYTCNNNIIKRWQITRHTTTNTYKEKQHVRYKNDQRSKMTY